jgi:hypothetical protein
MDKRKGYVLLLINAGVRNSVSECKKLQADLKHLEKWANKWGMRFNTKKCYVLSINNKSSRYYQLEKHTQEVQDNLVLIIKP